MCDDKMECPSPSRRPKHVELTDTWYECSNNPATRKAPVTAPFPDEVPPPRRPGHTEGLELGLQLEVLPTDVPVDDVLGRQVPHGGRRHWAFMPDPDGPWLTRKAADWIPTKCTLPEIDEEADSEEENLRAVARVAAVLYSAPPPPRPMGGSSLPHRGVMGVPLAFGKAMGKTLRSTSANHRHPSP